MSGKINTASASVNTAVRQGNPHQKEYKEKGVIDSGCSRYMTGNKCYLTQYEDYNGGFVSFGDGKGRISGEVLSSDFKLIDESQVLLRVPRKDNIYSVDLKSVVPTKGLTCLFAKATIDESNLWHRRLGHINFKNMNKLVRGNLVRGLPSKIFENDHSCVACQKGKQHKASCKAKLVNSISKPLHMLHMDLFGPINVKSIMKKSYCLVVTDDFSRFYWVFFFATKDETNGILKTFITEIENQLDYKVKVIRSDNGTEFKNSVMNQFCEMKGIKREFSVARTPQQNGVAERRNRTLIEAARTMLVDSKLPTTFWAEAVNTACYVLNRVLVIKPHTKTPYELIRGRTPLIDFMKPFGCPVTILNTRDHLGKFDGKADEGFFVGYSVVSKAMRVFNKRTRIVEETLNIRFLENAPNVIGNGPDWLFDVDSLTISMNYVPVVAGNQTNGPKDSKKDDGIKPTEVNVSGASDKDREDDQATRSKFERLLQQEKQIVHPNSTNSINNVSTPVSTARPSFINDALSSPVNAARTSEEHLFEKISPLKNLFALPHIPNVFSIDDTRIFGNAYDDEDVGAEADLNNLETTMNVSPIPTTRIDKDHPKDQIIRDLNLAIQTRRMTKISYELAMTASTLIETNKALLKDEEAEDVDVHLYRSMIGYHSVIDGLQESSMDFSMSATLTSSQKILTSSLEHFDVVTRNCDAVSTNYMPSLNHICVKLQSCPVSSQIESKSMVEVVGFIVLGADEVSVSERFVPCKSWLTEMRLCENDGLGSADSIVDQSLQLHDYQRGVWLSILYRLAEWLCFVRFYWEFSMKGMPNWIANKFIALFPL
ncbi:putative ribonuclease H-like domain-containing protein [Tanacetum coccineum]